jgi:predicted secreted protein
MNMDNVKNLADGSQDQRGKRIVYLSRCLLNQNLRFPGIAVKRGAIPELLDLLTRNDVGIESLPCLERMGWGGVSRRTFFRFQPFLFKAAGTRWFGIASVLARIWLFRFSRLCKREAVNVASEMEDFVRAGYSILGVVAMNDSPTCGVSRTILLAEAALTCKRLGFGSADLEKPELETMRRLIPLLCTGGQGLFMKELTQEIARRDLGMNVVGFDPWVDAYTEADRVARMLDLER